MTDLYTERLLSYWNPNLRGFHDQDYTHMASETSSLCGDEVEFRVTLKDGLLETVDVWARGCCLSECCAAMLAKLARGKPLVWLDTFTDQDWVNHVNVPVGESRKKSCLMLPLRCLRRAFTN
jgi:NifU-like protein involved in Fe-S cluster formation